MVLTPHTREELALSLADASKGGGRVSAVDLRNLRSLVEHKPEDMTATVEAGMFLGVFQEQLHRAGQWLPVDPPGADTLTVGDLLAYNRSGPRRFGYGTIRDYLIGIKVALANGEVIKAGGKVVKNVAGYDLCKVFVGAQHTLGIIVEAVFKLRPLPEKEVVLESSFLSISSLKSVARTLAESPAEPIIFDAHNLREGITLVIGFAGPNEDVDYQVEIARKIAPWVPGTTAYNEEFVAAGKMSVLPTDTADTLERLMGAAFIARFGNGVIYHNCPEEKQALPNPALAERLKLAYDPQRIFPDYTL